MRIFGTTEAQHFVSAFGWSTGPSEGDINDFRANGIGARTRRIREGTPLFQEYRDCSLRNVERYLFLAASHYRRALDLMVVSSSPWAHVTLYYGHWNAAHALLGMFGCTVFKRKWVMDVHRGTPGQQVLRYRQIGTGAGQQSTRGSGSHEIFWDLFYRAVQVNLILLRKDTFLKDKIPGLRVSACQLAIS